MKPIMGGLVMTLLACCPVLAQDKQVIVEILPSANVALGKTIKMRVTSKRAGWLTVLDLRADGKMTQLFPSECVKPGRKIRANAPINIPDPTFGCEFTADEAGSGQIIAVVSDENVRLEKLVPVEPVAAKKQTRSQTPYRSIDVEGLDDEPPAAKSKPQIAKPKPTRKTLPERLLAVWKNKPKSWSLGRVEYRIAK